MKPKRHFHRFPFLSGTIRYGVPVVAGFAIFISGISVTDAAIFGGAPGTGTSTPSNPQPTAPAGGATPTASDAARDSALQAIARTREAVGAAKALQDAARAAAVAANNAGPNPANPSQTLPDVPNGLTPGGLQPVTGATPGGTTWQGAELPTQAIENGLSTVTVRQTAQQALLTWQTFNVGRDTTLNFDQSAGGSAASQWIAFNKVNDPTANPTQILGQIKAEGQVYIINPNGIIFGASSQVNVNNLTASSLPINDNLVARGLLNNPSQEFLFNGLGYSGKIGDVTVQAGARISTPMSADGNGGRIALVGANVTNNGTLTSPNGQVILAAGLQVGVAAHASSDPSLRGLDVYVGTVTDPASALSPYAGSATNNGIIEISRASAIITGKSVAQNGIIDSSTSVSLNGRVDLLANYDAVANNGFDASNPSTGTPFLHRSTGSVTLGEGSVTRILPELDSDETVIGTELALRSQVNLQGKTVHFGPGSILLAPNAIANVLAGNWNFIASPTLPVSSFISNGGQVYLDSGSLINLSGTVDARASVTQNLITLELRGTELAVAPLQREGELRGQTITVDLGKTGYHDGRFWVGTPLADLTGYVGLVQRNVGQLTTAGGTLNLSAGGSVVVQEGSTIEVSGGWTNFTGDMVSTTQIISGGRLVEISEARPDEIYGGIFNPTITVPHGAWGSPEIFPIGLLPNGPRYLAGYTHGAAGGTLNLTAPSMALDGNLVGHTIAGENQIRNSTSNSALPPAATLNIRFQAQRIQNSTSFTYYPTPPSILFVDDVEQTAAAAFSTDTNGNPAALSSERSSTVYLSPEKLASSGFGNLSVSNPEGEITVPAGSELNLGPGSSITLTSSNITVAGDITAAGGSLSFNVHNISPYLAALEEASGSGITLPPTPGLGNFMLSTGATLSTAGLPLDDRLPTSPSIPALTNGGAISINAWSANLAESSTIDVSGGFLVSAPGQVHYGQGGSISIRTGQDIIQNSVLGGSINLGSTLLGYSGIKGGSLAIQSQTIQIGGATPSGNILHLDPDFFNEGGFSSFSLTGLASQGSNPALLVADNTVVEPVVRKLEILTGDPSNPALTVNIIDEPVAAYRQAASIRLIGQSPEGAVIGNGAVIRTDPRGSISVTGQSVTILGSLIAPGGSISVGGSNSTAAVFGPSSQARVTTHIGANALLSTAGATLLVPDPHNLRLGTVLDGGTITLTGNIAAEAGAILDVSGTSAILDLHSDATLPSAALSPGSSLLPYQLQTVPTRIDSNGGTITLSGGELLASDATLLAHAGGSTSLGGTLHVSSRLFDPFGVASPSDVNLTVTQGGPLLTPGTIAIGSTPGNGGRFTADTFANGGFDSLTLNGVVSFSGPVAIAARGELRLASGGFLHAGSQVNLSAAYAHIGHTLQPATLPEDAARSPFDPLTFSPIHGSGNVTIDAPLIDIGNLSLRNIGNLTLIAENGDIRGSGTLHIAGDLTLRAGQIHPTTASTLSFVAYNHGGTPGTIRVEAAGTRQLPWSAGGTLNLHASVIHQNGTLRAPFGIINLGWDGSGTAPIDILTGAAKPLSTSLTLGSSSVTSVSAVDPLTGKALTLPYGFSSDGEKWIDPRGVDITTSGPPEKAVNLLSASLVTEEGSIIDLRGGGDLYAYRFVPGLGGIDDILASSSRFAVVPGYEATYAPVLDYNPSGSANNLIAGQSGYSNATLKVGDRIHLAASATLPAGYYTLLPARYALLPGAVLVTPIANDGLGVVELTDGASSVPGYRYNSLNSERTLPSLSTRFEVASPTVFRQRALYEDYLANTFLTLRANALNIAVPPLPQDSARLVFQASQSLAIAGSVSSFSISGGLGALIDISSPLDIHIGGTPAPGSITLDPATLSSFEARSLLIGGRRIADDGGYTVHVATDNITIDNSGNPLSALDLVLVSKNGIDVTAGSVISATASPAGTNTTADTLSLTGNGSLLRVSSASGSPVIRTGSTAAGGAALSIGAGASISGNSVVLDSSSLVDLSASALLNADSYTFGSGRISLLLQNPGTLLANPGLVLTGETLLSFQQATALTLVSYSSIDLYGTGTIGDSSLNNLTLSTGEIRGINQGDGSSRLVASNLTLSNIPSASPTVPSGTPSGSLSFEAETITLGTNTATIGSYADVSLLASRAIIGDGTGGLVTHSNLNLTSPVLTGTAGSIRTISAGGHLSVNGNGSLPTSVTPGLGASLNLTAASISAAGNILLPSGSIQLAATTGDVVVGGLLDVSGTRTVFDQTVRYTGGGNITLSSNAGNVTIGSSAVLDLAADPGGAGAGNLSVSTPSGGFSSSGTILAQGGNGGRNGSFSLDTASLASLSPLAAILAQAHLTDTQAIRVRNGDVLVDGISSARDFRLAADSGSITVTGTIDASGATGGDIFLSANGNLTVGSGATLTVRGEDFSNAGKGGHITLEAGSQRNGTIGDGTLDVRAGSTLDLSVASEIAGNTITPGSSAYSGNFSGKLHLRAPQTSTNTDLRVATLGGNIIGASSILVEGYRLYDLTSTGGLINIALQDQILANGQNFIGTAGATNGNYNTIVSRLLSGNTSLEPLLVLAPGVEIINRTGDLTLGSAATTTTSDWDLSTFRFGPKSAPGVLTLRAAGDLVFHNSLSDGFTPLASALPEERLWLARLTNQNTLLPVNLQTWSYHLTAGADLTAAAFAETLGPDSLLPGKGSLILGKLGTNTTASNLNSLTSSLISTHYQVIRTGSGDIDINTGLDVRLLNQLTAIYTAGTRVTNPTLDGAFQLPSLTNQTGATNILGAVQQAYPATYSMAGGNITLNAGRNIERLTRNLAGQIVPDSQLQLPTNWLYRRGHVDPATGGFSSSRFSNNFNSTTWWIDFSNFFQGTGTLGGGDVTLTARNNISNVDAVAATNARMSAGTPSTSTLLELGGGDLVVRAGNNIDAGIYYVERGQGTLHAGNNILTNATRSVLAPSSIALGLTSDHTNLPTTLFLGKGSFNVSANGDLLLGPIANPFLLPQGLGNSFWYKTYFSTYAADNEVNVTSLGGDVTIRTSSTLPLGQNSGTAESLLQSWYSNKLLLTTTSVSLSKPWLRLSEGTSVAAFSLPFTLSPPTLRTTAFSGDINLAGNIILAPSPTGTSEIIAGGSINALQPNGFVTIAGVRTTTWGTSTILISDADPAALPGITTPLGRPNDLSISASTAALPPATALDPLNRLFLESGATLGLVLESKQALHTAGHLHLSDNSPTLIYAGKGSISGLTLYSPKLTRIVAGLDISDIAFYIQNLRPSDISIISAGRNILAHNSNSLLRVDANSTGNSPNLNATPLAGDIQISGPGTLQVLAGGNIDLGTGGNNPDGTGAGITSIGNARNPYLPFGGADLLIGAGISSTSSLSTAALNFGDFIEQFVTTPHGSEYLNEIDPDLDFSSLNPEQQAQIAIEVFLLILRDAGRNYPETGNYDTAYAAIDTLFGELGEDETRPLGSIFTRARDIRTSSGGDINIIAPGGGLTLANSTLGNTLSPPGIITASGGNISIFAQDDISIGIGRIFTLRGGNEIIWSSDGNIAAGSSSKTVLSAPPTRVIIDPQSAAVQTDLAGLSTGGGIGVLATVAGVEPGNVDLIAPNGYVDAGDAGIRSAGNLNISANQVLNAGNISTGGTSTGTPAVVSVSTSMGGLTTATTPPAPPAAATSQVPQETLPEEISTEEVGADISVEIIGYGGTYDDEDDEEEKRRKRQAEEAAEAGDQPAEENNTSE